MCGICGLVYSDSQHKVETHLLDKMNDVLSHRGPDGDGTYIQDNVGLGHRRLAIIDLVTGEQPLSNEDKSIQIVFNGEIYNFPELRSSLESAGHTFRTHTDTEVIVHAYEEYGVNCLEHLDGMFSFALWDDRKKTLFAARDRMGKKPFYYTRNREGFIFGSELKSLLQHPSVKKEIDPVALHHYLTLQYVPDPYSIYKDIFKLPPAHFLILKDNKYQIRRYWDVVYKPKLQISENEAAEELHRILKEAVKKRLISDVPLGAFLSGGIDSSIVVTLMAELCTEPVKTFSIGFNYEAFNELPYARAIAEKWGTEHHEFIVTPENAADIIPKLVRSFDEPFADSCAFQTYYLAQLTRQHVTVALNGDGGDETFAGYPRYWLDRYVKPYTALPRFITQDIIPKMVSQIPEPSNIPIETNWIMGVKRLAQVAATSPKASIVRWGSYFSEDMKQECLNDEMRVLVKGHQSDAFLSEFFDRAYADSFLDRTLYTDLLNYLPGNNLVKMDRMTMAHGLEARSPLLDKKYVEFSACLPEKMKIKGRQTKYLLRKMQTDILPDNIRDRNKRGFAAPVEEWCKKDLRDLIQDSLLSPNSKIYDFFKPDRIQQMVSDHQKGRINHGRRIWTLLILEEWYRNNQQIKICMNPECKN